MPALPSLSGGMTRLLIAAIAIGWCGVQFAPAIRGGYEYEIILLGVHAGAAIAIVLLTAAATGGRREAGASVPCLDVALAAVAIVSALYFLSQGERISERIPGVDSVLTADYIFGALLIATLLEACRRSAGITLTAVAVIFIFYLLVGPWLPEPLTHRGLTLKRFIDLQTLSWNGVFGTPLSASAHMVFYFVIVGAFLERSGAGKLFVDVAYAATAGARGGAGKAAVISSGLFGMVSGSAVANVLLSGIMTIPLMKRAGFKPVMAGAIEATASTGGQLAPPIMGAAAFILADVVGVPYSDVVLAAIVPAILYYLSLFLVVHFHAVRHDMAADHAHTIRDSLSGLKARWHLLIPLAVMVILLVEQYSLMFVGVIATVLTIVTSWLKPATRLGPKECLGALLGGCRAAAEVAVPSAVAGIIVGAIVHTGMALDLQRSMLALAGDSTLIALIGAMLLTIILGMGMPTAAAYMVSAILVAPALQNLGVPPLAAHMFILYFGILSMVTPPVALSAYAAAGISGANMWSTGVSAFMLALPGFVIPFAFAFNDALILNGSPIEIARVLVSSVIGIVCMSSAVAGHLLLPLGIALRAALIIAGPLLISPQVMTDLIGVSVLALVGLVQFSQRRRFAKSHI